MTARRGVLSPRGLPRPGESLALGVMLAVCALSSALGALLPMSPAAPVRLNGLLSALALSLAIVVVLRPHRLWSHVCVLALLCGLTALTSAAATPAGTAVLGMSFTWAAAFAAFFLARSCARSYGGLACACFGLGLLLNPFPGAGQVWFLTAVTATVVVEAVSALIARLERAASTDPLTGLLNRAGLQRHASALLAAASRSGAPLSVAVVDLDGFKAVNDRQGHAAGDALLQALASSWQAELRERDLLARLGGDEFVLVLPDTSHGEAGRLLERLAAVSVASWSAGLTTRRTDADLHALLLEADRDLYAAKRRRDVPLVPEPRSRRAPAPRSGVRA